LPIVKPDVLQGYWNRADLGGAGLVCLLVCAVP